MTNKTRKGTVMNVEIAQRLAELRRERGFSQEDLAAQLGLSRQAVSKWERAESAPDMGNLIALADLYEVTIDELLRVSPEVEEDMRYESQERAESAEAEAAQAAATAQEAAARAETAAVEAAAAIGKEAEPAKVVVEVNASAPGFGVSGSGGPGAKSPNPSGPCVAGSRPAEASLIAGSGHPAGFGPSPAAGPVPSPGPGAPGYAGAPGGRPVPPAASVPIAPTPPSPKDPLRSFPYPVLCVIIFLLVGFCFGWWHPGWIVFLTIPFYYWIVNTLEADPAYQGWRAERASGVTRPGDWEGDASRSTANAQVASESDTAAPGASDQGGAQ